MTTEAVAAPESEPAGPAKRVSRLARGVGVALAVIGGLAWLGILMVMVIMVPRFETIFEKFNVRGGLPTLTQSLINTSHMIGGLWPIGVLLIIAVTAALAYASAIAHRWSRVVVVGAFGLFSFAAVWALLSVITMGVFAPLVKLMDTVNSKQ